MDSRLVKLEEDVSKILTNHLPHMNEKLAAHGERLEWLVWAAKLLMGGVLTAVLVSVLNLVIKN